jgi:hypothetical protein
MIRAGTPQATVMGISGHRTISTFLRYGITSEQDKVAALKRTQGAPRGAAADEQKVSTGTFRGSIEAWAQFRHSLHNNAAK